MPVPVQIALVVAAVLACVVIGASLWRKWATTRQNARERHDDDART